MKPNFQIITIEELRQNLLEYREDLNSFWIKVDRIDRQPNPTKHNKVNFDLFSG